VICAPSAAMASAATARLVPARNLTMTWCASAKRAASSVSAGVRSGQRSESGGGLIFITNPSAAMAQPSSLVPQTGSYAAVVHGKSSNVAAPPT
jgi:hypothetical protein